MTGALIRGESDATAIVAADRGETITFGELEAAVLHRARQLTSRDADLALVLASNSISSAVDYLAARRSEVPVMMVDPDLADDDLARLLAAYEPSIVLGDREELHGYASTSDPGLWRIDGEYAPIENGHGVSVLLPTSGSTGSPKFVQLSNHGLNVNAVDIATSLTIAADDRGLQPLPLFYSYGLSILNSHLAVGATTVLTTASPVRPEFWDIIESQSVTSIPGVPYSYAMFERAGLLDRPLPSLRYMTQAGGKLAAEKVLAFGRGLAEKRTRFCVMYGQTEASPRMSVLPSDDLVDHAHSVGFALDHGKFTIFEPNDDGVGEVLYDGPNVMVGYASTRDDVGVRTQFGPLETGDLGYLDGEGRLAITGRIKRFAKLFGHRVALQDVETHFAFLGPVAAVEGDNAIVVFAEHPDTDPKDAIRELERRIRVPPRTVTVRRIDELPRLANGKIDYGLLRREA